MAKRATLAPRARQVRSPDEMLQEMEEQLRNEFSLGMLGRFSVIVEGWTDVGYIELAVGLNQQASGGDLLEIPEQIAGTDHARIEIFTPGRAGDPSRGGTPQMIRLAEMLRPYVFTIRAFDGLMFVFDHDDEGQRAATDVEGRGYKRDVNIATLDPRQHPNACAKKQVCIEDLLSLDIQRRFFESTPATCSVDYVDGEQCRFRWGHNSKAALRDYVVKNACINDVREIVQLVKRIRHGFGLPE